MLAIAIPPQALQILAALGPQLLGGGEKRPPVQPAQLPQFSPQQIAPPPSAAPPDFSEPLPGLRPVDAPRPSTAPIYAEGTGPGIAGAFGGPMPDVGAGFDAKDALPKIASAVGQQFLKGEQERRDRLRSLATSGPGVQEFRSGFIPFTPPGVNFGGLFGGSNG